MNHIHHDHTKAKHSTRPWRTRMVDDDDDDDGAAAAEALDMRLDGSIK